MSPSRRRLLVSAALAVAAATAFSGCGTERSAEAYCKAFYAKAAPIREEYVDRNEQLEQNPLGAIATLFSAPGDLEAIFDGMVDHAPDEIKSDTVVVRDSFEKLQESMGDALGDPLAAFGGALMSSLTSSGASRRVDEYLAEHCPVSSPLAQEIINDAGGD